MNAERIMNRLNDIDISDYNVSLTNSNLNKDNSINLQLSNSNGNYNINSNNLPYDVEEISNVYNYEEENDIRNNFDNMIGEQQINNRINQLSNDH